MFYSPEARLRALAGSGRRPPGERWDDALVLEIGRRAFDHPWSGRADQWDPVAPVVERVRRRLLKRLEDGRPHPLSRYDPAIEIETGNRAFWALSSNAARKRWGLTPLDFLGLLMSLRPQRLRERRELEHQRRQHDERRRGMTEGTWRRLRRDILAAEPRCRLCGGRATHVDHITPVWRGGETEPDNLQPLCRGCHEEKSAKEQASWSDGIRLSLAVQRAGRRSPSSGSGSQPGAQ